MIKVEDTLTHGFTDDEWRATWALVPWQKVIADTLVKIARSPDATFEDRCSALQTINEAVRNRLITIDVGFPELTRDVFFSMVVDRRQSLFARWRRRRLNRRLFACRTMLLNASVFLVDRMAPVLSSNAS